jgi:hypothetical protein
MMRLGCSTPTHDRENKDLEYADFDLPKIVIV